MFHHLTITVFYRQVVSSFTMHSFLKVFYILVSTAGCWVSLTPPNLPPERDEKAESITLEVLLKQRFALYIMKVSYQDIKL